MTRIRLRSFSVQNPGFMCFVFFVMVGLISCQQNPGDHNEDILVRVGPYTLDKSMISAQYMHTSEFRDSQQVATSFIENWAHDKAFEMEAMKRLESQEELDELINAYRSSLMTHLLEKQLVEQELDSFISEADLAEYYENNKMQFILGSSIWRLHYIRVDKEIRDLDLLRQLWERWDHMSGMDSLIAMCNESAEVYLLDDSTWYRQDELKPLLPENVLSSQTTEDFSEQSFSNDSTMIFLRVLEQVPDTEVAPLSYIEKQARKVILFQRRQELLRSERERIYREALKANRIKYYF